MALNLNVRQATVQAMRGNMPRPVVVAERPKAVEPAPTSKAPEPAPAPVTIDMAPVADALLQGQQMSGQLSMQMLKELVQVMKANPVKDMATVWTFKITERDRMGNIISFTAVPASSVATPASGSSK